MNGYRLWAIGVALLAMTIASGCPAENSGACTVTDNGDGTATISCEDGTEVTITNGTDGMDGTTCSVTDNGDGTATIDCSDGTTYTVTNGVDGLPGDSCSVADNMDGTYTLTCDDGTVVTLTDGTDGMSCTVLDNGNGSSTIVCEDGSVVTVYDGADGDELTVADFHGMNYLLSTGEFLTAGKYFATATITSATADAAGLVTVNFSVVDGAGDPVTDVPDIDANIVALVPPAAGEAYTTWRPYIFRTQTVTGSSFPNPDGTTAEQAYRENTGTFTNNLDGTYSYVFATDISAATFGGVAVPYDRSLTHRVSIMMGGHSGATANAWYDFVPDGSGPVTTRDVVNTDACRGCHGWEFHGHGGDRLDVENCITCHAPGSVDPHSGETLDMKVMIHKIHAGAELASIPGADGIVFDNPGTGADESADNGEYAIYGYMNSKHEWWKVEFPAVIENCVKCHDSGAADADNWMDVPSRAACGSCHDETDFATGTNHGGGAQANDNNCTGCHPATGAGVGESVTDAHDWLAHDIRKVPEFGVDLTVSTPANGMYFVAGETPVVTLILTDLEATPPTVIDHTTVLQDGSAEGCTGDPCPAKDGLFRGSKLMVHGPRAHRMPVLTTNARSAVKAPTAGPYDLSTAVDLQMIFDGGEELIGYNVAGGEYMIDAAVTVPVSSGTFVSLAAATGAEIVTWLNADADFAARGIAYMDEATGNVAVRSRNLGTIFSLQLLTSDVNAAVFGDDTAVHMPLGSYPSNELWAATNPANNDPKAVRTTGSITYTLDPVDDLMPGTYVASVEIADRGNTSGTNFKTPSVGKVTFQVGVAAEEPLVAGNCDSCHMSEAGVGFVLDFRRHYKIFDNTALDQCGACHDYNPRFIVGTAWEGAKPISKRVHGIHFGSDLNYPLLTVDYSNGDPIAGRNWDIEFPMDVRNCEACHPDGTSSGTWVTKPSRLPCWGCHDSDAAQAHMRIMTSDPTPGTPFSGDEVESCTACHTP